VKVDVDVAVTIAVVTVVGTNAVKPKMLPTTQPFVEDTIQTALSAFSTPVIGCAKTRVQVKPFQ